MTIKKILIVEDEQDIRDLIHFHLFKKKYEVFEANDGEQALLLAKENSPDLIILDIMIPKINGLELCKVLKNSHETKSIRIIFLSAKGEEEDIVRGLELGADDYVTKPFSPRVLMARVETVLSRGSDSSKLNNIINAHGISLDLKKRKVEINEDQINLTMSEYELLKYLMSSPGHVFTRGQIVNKIKGINHAITDRSVDTQLVSLRKKMKEKGKCIESVWGVGYRFKEHEE